jgi:hypothetical protein
LVTPAQVLVFSDYIHSMQMHFPKAALVPISHSVQHVNQSCGYVAHLNLPDLKWSS